LADAYPNMDAATLTSALTRLLFAAAVLGKLSARNDMA
jgi:phage gp29-like protein